MHEMTTELLVLSPEDVDILENVAMRARGSVMKQYGKRFLKGIKLHDQMISREDRDMDLTEFDRIVDKVRVAGNTLLKGFVYTIELSDQRVSDKGIWHKDTDEPDSWLNLMVPLDDITSDNGGTVLYGNEKSHTFLYGARGHVYAFKGCVRHCVEGNRLRSPRRLLIIVIRPCPFLKVPNVNVETYRRIMTLQSNGTRRTANMVHVVHGMQTRSKKQTS